jgi:hypothetical protein
MRRRFGSLSLFVVLLVVSAFIGFGQTRTRPAPKSSPPPSDIKIKYRTSVAGQTTESTSMIKGLRERTESSNAYAGNMISITQCDLKRTIQISEKARKYVVTSMEPDAQSQTGSSPSLAGTAGPTRKGGVVTYTTTATDTGERKEMFGFTARHIKTSINIESSPDACNQTKQRMETDGWYIDLNFAFNCDRGQAQMAANRRMRPDCQDDTRFRRVGAAKTGYPLSDTTTMYGPDGAVTFTMTRDVLELTREPLDPALFDIPAGYAEAQSTQELYAPPSAESTNSSSPESPTNTSQPSATNDTKAAGTLRIGVVPLNNKTDRSVSTENLRERLIGQIQAAGVEAVPLNADSQTAAENEARLKQCDFILFTDISSLKSSKVGGMLGRVTGVGGSGKTDSRIDFKLFAVGENAPRIQSSATAKEEGDETSAGIALDSEAKLITAAIRKN